MRKIFLLFGVFAGIASAMPTRTPRPNNQAVKPNLGRSNFLYNCGAVISPVACVYLQRTTTASA